MFFYMHDLFFKKFKRIVLFIDNQHTNKHTTHVVKEGWLWVMCPRLRHVHKHRTVQSNEGPFTPDVFLRSNTDGVWLIETNAGVQKHFSLDMTQICEEQPVVIYFPSTDFKSHFCIFKLKHHMTSKAFEYSAWVICRTVLSCCCAFTAKL